jgi:hypothetical protein
VEYCFDNGMIDAGFISKKNTCSSFNKYSSFACTG